ncbi:MAG: type II toxin-antitoxin system HicB family antitoxin [Cyanobacteria bacterium P01_F01_bin.150]
MKYKGYTAIIEFDEKTEVLRGEVLDLGGLDDSNALHTFEVQSSEDILPAFHKTVDKYLELCKAKGKVPEKPFSGKMPFRTTPQTHREIYIAASQARKSVNAWMEKAVQDAIDASKINNDSGNIANEHYLGPISKFFEEHPKEFRQVLDALCLSSGLKGLSSRAEVGRIIMGTLEIFDRCEKLELDKGRTLEDLASELLQIYSARMTEEGRN